MATCCSDGRYRLRPARTLKEWKELHGRTEYDHYKAKLVPRKSRTKTKEKYRSFRMSLLACRPNSRYSGDNTICWPRNTPTITKKATKRSSQGARKEAQEIQVFVRTPVKTTLCLQVHKETSVIDLKKMIADRLGTTPNELQLSTGKYQLQLCDQLSLEDHGVKTESNIFVTFTGGLLGGADRPPDEISKTTDSSAEPGHEVKPKVIHNHVYIQNYTNMTNVARIVGDSNTLVMTDTCTGEKSIELPIRAKIVPSQAENVDDKIRNAVMALVGQYHKLEKFAENQKICQDLVELFKESGPGELNRVGVGSLWFFVQFKSCEGLQNIWKRYTDGRLAQDISKIIITKELQEQATCNLDVEIHIDDKVYLQASKFLEQVVSKQSSASLPLHMQDWTCDDVKTWLTSIDIPSEVVKEFHEEAIDGKVLAVYKGDDMFADFRSSGLKKGYWRNLLYSRDEYLRESVPPAIIQSVDMVSPQESQDVSSSSTEATDTATTDSRDLHKEGARPKATHIIPTDNLEKTIQQSGDQEFLVPLSLEDPTSEDKATIHRNTHAIETVTESGTQLSTTQRTTTSTISSTVTRSIDQQVENKELMLRKLLFGDVQQKWFDKGYYPILVANRPPARLLGKDGSDIDGELSFIRNIDWTIVFDLYANSKGDGLCKYYEAKGTPLLQQSEIWDELAQTLDDTDDLEGNPLWLFCNGRVDDPTLGISKPMELKQWNEERSRNVEDAISYFSSSYFIPSDRSIIIFLILSEDDIDILGDIFRKFSSAFQGVQNLTCIIESKELYEKWVKEVQRYCSKEKLDSRSFVGVPLYEVNSFIQRMIKVNRIKPLLLAKGGRNGCCQLAETDLRRWKDVSVLCKNECAYTDMDENHLDFPKFRKEKELDFYRGNEVDWWNFSLTEKKFNDGKGYNHVLKRQVHSDLRKKVELAFADEISQDEINPLVTIPIFHQPGSGATTLGKHILWEFRNSHRCVVVNRITPNTANEILEIHRYGYEERETIENPVLILSDADTFELTHLISDLENASRDRGIVNLVCVVLHCSRVCDPSAANVERTGVTLLHQLHKEERAWFQKKYNDLENRGKQSGKADENPDKMIGFMMLKEEFNPEFISKVVSQNLMSLENTSEKEYNLLKYLSILSHYGEHGEGIIPVPCCDEFMSSNTKGNQSTRNQLWEKSLSETAQMLLLPTTDAGIYGIKLVHRYLGVEILRQLHERGELLADIMNSFLSSRLLSCKSKTPYTYMRYSVQQLLIHRKRIECGDEEDTQFSQLIEHVYSRDKSAALKLLDKGFQTLKDPWVAQQAARMCYIRYHDFHKAHSYTDKAINLMKKSPFLSDTKGQIYMKEMVKKFGDHCLNMTTLPANESKQLIAIAFKALEWFRTSQMYADEKDGYADFTGYFHEANVIFRVLKTLERCVEPFAGESGLENLKRYLVMADYIPDKIRSWEKYHTDMKDLKSIAGKSLSRIDDYLTFCEDASSSDLPIAWFEEYKRQGKTYINQFQRFFGEFTGHGKLPWTTELDECEARRRKVISMGVHRFQSVFECLYDRDPLKKLRRVHSILIRNKPGNLFDQRILVFITFALSTIEDEPTTSAKEMLSMVEQLCEVSPEDDLYGPFFKLMLHWPIQGKSRGRFKKQGNIVELVKLLKHRWEERFKNKEETSTGSPYGRQLAQPYKHARVHHVRPPTYFFLASGNALRHFTHISELKVSQKSINSERLTDSFWKQKETLGRLERLSGALYNANWLYYRTPGAEERVLIKLSIPVKGVTSQDEVTFFLGFSWGGPVAYDVRPVGRESKRVPTTSYRNAYPKVPVSQQTRSDIYLLLEEQSRIQEELNKSEAISSSLLKKHQSGKTLTKEEEKAITKTQKLRKEFEEVTEKVRRELHDDGE